MITDFKQMVSEVKSSTNRVIAVAAAQDAELLEALDKARKENLARAILVGDKVKIEKISAEAQLSLSGFEIHDVKDHQEAVLEAISLVKKGEANLLMKGLCSTASLMSAVLDKESGLRQGALLSHMGVFEVSSYHKLICMSDAALNIAPSLEEKIAITENAVECAHKLGIKEPRVAVLAAVEKISPSKMPATRDAAVIAKMAERGQICGALIDGPLALDNAFSKKSCEVKGIKSPVGGDADIAIVPDIEAGNIFYKLMSYLAGAKTAGIILGAKVPIILTSRTDSDETKFLSLATAVYVA